MIIKRYVTSMMNVDYVDLPNGEQLPAEIPDDNVKVYGMYVTVGDYEVVYSEDPQHIGRHFTAGAEYTPNNIICRVKVKANGDARWFCFSQNDEVRRNVFPLTVSGSAVLPSDHGFFVIEGTVEADGKTANQFQFFKPRPTALTVEGNGVLMLVE